MSKQNADPIGVARSDVEGMREFEVLEALSSGPGLAEGD